MVADATRERVTYNLGQAEAIPLGEGRAFRVGGISVAVYRTRAGAVYATQARCPHRDGPLADGIVGGSKVICPLHAYGFDLATGRPLGNDCPALATHPVWVDAEGDIVLGLDGQ